MPSSPAWLLSPQTLCPYLDTFLNAFELFTFHARLPPENLHSPPHPGMGDLVTIFRYIISCQITLPHGHYLHSSQALIPRARLSLCMEFITQLDCYTPHAGPHPCMNTLLEIWHPTLHHWKYLLCPSNVDAYFSLIHLVLFRALVLNFGGRVLEEKRWVEKKSKYQILSIKFLF